MSPEILGILVPIILGGGGLFLVGMKMRYNHLEETHLEEGSRQDFEQLTSAMDSLRGEFEKLNERVEFTERLLEKPKLEE